MKAFSQQNPVSIRIEKMREQWAKRLTDKDIKAVRWLIKPDEVRMVDAFCLIEGSEHGELPDMFLKFGSPLIEHELYDRTLLREWINACEDPKAAENIANSGVSCNWKPEPWKKYLESDEPFSIFDCMDDFVKSIGWFKEKLVVYIRPATIANEAIWIKWVSDHMEKGFSDTIRLMISDIFDTEFFKGWKFFDNAITLIADLNMAAAAREISTSGDPNNPSVQFNTCIFNMGDALARKNSGGVSHWGQKAFDLAEKNKNFVLQIAANLAYGSALYQLKNYKGAIDRFRQAREIANAGIASGQKECQALLLQAISFEGAVNMREKENKPAFECYRELSELAIQQENYIMALDGCYMAYYLSGKIGKYSESIGFLSRGYETAKTVGPESLKYSSMLLIGENYHKELLSKGDKVTASEVDAEMCKVWGEDWKELAKERMKDKNEFNKSGIYLNFDFIKSKS